MDDGYYWIRNNLRSPIEGTHFIAFKDGSEFFLTGNEFGVPVKIFENDIICKVQEVLN